MTELMTQHQAADLLGEHTHRLYECVDGGWARWLTNPDAATASKRTRASTVYDYITEEVEKVFGEIAGTSTKWKHGSLHLIIGDSAIIKFKKFRGRRLRTSGIPTNARKLFLRQSGVLEGMVVTHLVVGYLLDELEQAPEKIAIACPLGKGNLWVLDLGPGFGDEESGTTTPIPIAPVDPDQHGTTIRSTKIVANDDTAVNEE